MVMVNEHNLQKNLGLHQEIEIIYVVDGYVAKMINEDGYQPAKIAEGARRPTIFGALAALEEALRPQEKPKKYIAVLCKYYSEFAHFVNEKGLHTYGARYAENEAEYYVLVRSAADSLGFWFDEVVRLGTGFTREAEEAVRSHARPGAIGGNG